MKIFFYRPNDDQFWIGCSEEEAESLILPKMKKDAILSYLSWLRYSKRDKRSTRMTAMYRKLYGLKSIKQMPEVFFNVSRDLKVCFPQEPYFPIGPMWNAYSPFRLCDHKTIESLGELKNIKMTYKGIPYEEVDHENEAWI